MTMGVSGETGEQALSDGVLLNPFRQGRTGEIIASELHGRYYEQAYRGRLFSGANQSGVTTTVGLATTYVGLCLSNPNGSPVNLVLNKVGYTFLVAFSAASAIGLMVGYKGGTDVTHSTPITPRGNKVGSPAGYGLLDSSATLPVAPTVQTILGAGLTGAISTIPETPGDLVDLEGSIILPPGAFLAFFTSTASGTSGALFSMQWEEVAI